jgi:predicted Zn-dependent peptidase
VLAIAGDISLAEARKVVEAKLAAWKKRGTPAPPVEDPPAIGAGKIYFIARPNSVQTNFIVGTQGINRTAPDFDVVQVMNSVLGGGPTGRLFLILREEKGYTYGAYSGLAAGRFRGNWSASTEVRTDVTEAAFRDLMIQVARMRDEPVPEEEFQSKKRGMVASFALSLESPQSVLQNHITRWLYKLPADYFDRYPERIAAVTQAQVQEAARKYLAQNRLQIIAVGDPKIGETMKQFGTVETYDTEGKIVGK